MTETEIDETLSSVGIEVGRKASEPYGLNDGDELTQELPWEGLSDVGSDEER